MRPDLNELVLTLLPDIKFYIDITWDDEATDRKIRGLIADGIMYLDGKAGRYEDYTAAGNARALLKEYVRYTRDGALDVFENNYKSGILSLQGIRKVKSYVESSI